MSLRTLAKFLSLGLIFYSPFLLGQPSLLQIAHSERLGLRYFVVVNQGTDWCTPSVVVQVLANASRFSTNEEFLNLTQKAGSVLGNQCDKVMSANVVVVDETGTVISTPLWSGTINRSDGWAPVAKSSFCKPGDLDCSFTPPVSVVASNQLPPPPPPPPPPSPPLPPLVQSSTKSATTPTTNPASRPGKSFAGQKLYKKDFENENLRSANFEGADLTGANLNGAFAENAIFRHANLASVSFRKTNLAGADFTGAKIDMKDNITWVGAQLIGAKLPNFEFKLVGCANYYSSGVYDLASPRTMAMILDHNNGDLSFRNATLINSVFCGDMAGVDFRGADLRGADLTKTKDLSKAMLGGAKYDSQTRLPIDPEQFRMLRSPDLEPADMSKHGASASNKSSQGGQSALGEWWINRERPGQRETPQLGFIAIDGQGKFEWSPGDDGAKLIFGQWQQTKDGILLKSGEGGKDWIVSLILGKQGGESMLQIKSIDGKLSRTGYRKIDAKK